MLHLAGIDVDAISTAGLGTCIALPRLGIAFDLGVCPQRMIRVPTVLFTHGHIDHMGAVVQHCASRVMLGMAPARYVVPPEHVAGLRGVLEAWSVLDRNRLQYSLEVAGLHDIIPLSGGRYARPFRSPHTMPCQGYVVYETVRKLRSDWIGKPSAEIARARANGETISDDHEVPLVAFTGDSTVDVLDREPALGSVRLLIIEMTFADNTIPVDAARRRGHVHIDELLPRLEASNAQHILLTHLSARYSVSEVSQHLTARLSPEVRARVTLLPHLLP